MSSRDTIGNQTPVGRWLVAFEVIVALGALLMLASCMTVRAGEPIATLTPTPQPVLTPTIELVNTDARLGDLVHVVGEGWPEGATIVIELRPLGLPDEAGQTVASVLATEIGRFELSFTFPSDARWDGAAGAVVRAWYPATGEDASALLGLLPSGETPEPALTSTPTAGCTDRASFVADVTIPDDAYVQPGQSFVKTWRLRNSGTCTWTVDYALAYVGGHRMGGASAVALGGAVGPGSAVDLSVTLVAPSSSGVFEGRWQLRNAEGRLFGFGARADRPVWVRIRVGPTPIPTPMISPWRGEYFNNPHLAGSPVHTRDDAAVSFDWGTGSPVGGLPADRFSARWTRTLWLEPGTYRFHALSDDGVRIWLDGQLIIDEWHAATGGACATDRVLAAGVHTLRVEYYESTGVARIQFWWETLVDTSKWRGEYFANPDLTGIPRLTRDDAALNFDWGRGAPAPELPADGFSARWTRTMWFDGGQYRFHVLTDDGARLYVDSALIVGAWSDGGRREVTGDATLASGYHTVRVEYYERTGDAVIQMWCHKVTYFPDWKGRYWPNRSLSGSPILVRNDATVDFNWGMGSAAPGLPTDNFSARWTRTLSFEDGVYRFQARADDGIRLYLDGELIVDKWQDSAGDTTYKVEWPVSSGQHTLRVEYYDHTGQALVKVWWKRVADLPTPTPAPNHPPVAVDDSATTDQGTPVTIKVLANDTDPDGDVLTVTAFSATSKQGGNVSCTDAGWCTYTPLPTFVGSDSFTYVVSDGKGGASTGTVTVLVEEVAENRPPIAADDVATTEQDVPVTVNVLANDSDPDGDALAVIDYDASSFRGGSVQCTEGGVCEYEPPESFAGRDRFAYTVSDGRGGTDAATVVVLVQRLPVNAPPVAVDDSATTEQDTPVTVDVLQNDWDPDEDQLVVSAFDATSVRGGSVQCREGGVCEYEPPESFAGRDRFAYTVSDGRGGTDAATVVVLVQRLPVNAPPVAVDDSATTEQDTPVTVDVLQNDWDPDEDQLVVSAFDATSVRGGEVDCTATGACTYTPRAGLSGRDRFEYTVGDGKGGTDVGTVRLIVERTARVPGDVVISEILPVPAAEAEAGEWIELHNAGRVAIDLGGWYLDDGEGGSDPYRIPEGTLIQPGAFLVFYEARTGITLDDTGDEVRLLRPDGTLAASVVVQQLPSGVSWSRGEDGVWHADWPPSPGAPNLSNSADLRASGWARGSALVVRQVLMEPWYYNAR